jgi:hypothetical protein
MVQINHNCERFGEPPKLCFHIIIDISGTPALYHNFDLKKFNLKSIKDKPLNVN